MFRRLVTVAPRSVGTIVSPRITPALSGLQTQQPIFRASPAPQRRGYHEKDKSPWSPVKGSVDALPPTVHRVPDPESPQTPPNSSKHKRA